MTSEHFHVIGQLCVARGFGAWVVTWHSFTMVLHNVKEGSLALVLAMPRRLPKFTYDLVLVLCCEKTLWIAPEMLEAA